MKPQITEVSAPSGRRRWVYGPLDPARPMEIKAMSNPPAPEEAVALIQQFLDGYCGEIKRGLVAIWSKD